MATAQKSKSASKKEAVKPVLKKIRTIYGVTEYLLPNGLRILFRQVKSSPTVAVCITYHVGSRNEVKGHTGATHILEHLLFKDSKNFNKKNHNAITDYLEWLGAHMNATTSLDRTNYYELLPRERLEDALAIEADRMRGALFTDKDLASEMVVVRNEYERGRNNPYEILNEAVTEHTFSVHPYRIPTIGTKEDIENSTAKTLRNFYDTYYWPNNATLAVVGDVSKADLEKLVRRHFGPVPMSPHPIPTMDTVEPQQLEPRSCVIEKPVGISIVEIAHKTPAADDPDYPAVAALVTILAGGFASRLQHTIVDTGLASDIHILLLPTIDPSATSLIVSLTEKSTPEKVLGLIRAAIHAIAEIGVSRAELKRAQTRILGQLSHDRDGAMNEVSALSEAVAAGDWTLVYRSEEQIKALTLRDIQRVAATYFISNNETSGILINTL
jgi:zinc protease